MIKTKRRRIFFVVVSIAIAAAGTLLTLLNNIDVDAFNDDLMKGLLITGIAVARAACFTACEAAFVWAHKEIEDTSRLWRKAVLIPTAIMLVLIMGFAAYQEMIAVHAKISDREVITNTSMLLKNADRRAQRGIARDAIEVMANSHQSSKVMPFAVAYVAAGVAALIIGAVGEGKKQRTRGNGNLLASDTVLQQRVQSKYGLDPATTRAYKDRNGKGAAVWHRSKQVGYVMFEDHPSDSKSRVYDPADARKQ